MNKTKLTIIYYSQTGVNLSMAKKAAETAESFGAEVRLRKVKELLDTSNVIEGSAWEKVLKEEKYWTCKCWWFSMGWCCYPINSN